MKEIRLVLPDAAGPEAQQWLETAFASTFGGWTRAQTSGAWLSPEGKLIVEPGNAYDVAVNDVPASDFALKRIVGELFARTSEQAIYVRGRSGEVEIIDRFNAANAA